MNRFQRRQQKRQLQRQEFNRPRSGQLVRVTRYYEGKDALEYLAIYWEKEDGKCELEPVKAGATGRVLFHLYEYVKDEPIPGYLNWYMISGMPVLISPRARIAAMTGIVMKRMGERAAA